jgi:hypothetical protein
VAGVVRCAAGRLTGTAESLKCLLWSHALLKVRCNLGARKIILLGERSGVQ